jgi:hypothetical protein
MTVVAAVIGVVHLNASSRFSLAWDASILLLGFALYLHTLAPDVLPADSGEFQFVSHVLGIAHPPGYPLYTLVSKVFTLLPWANVAYRVNLFASVTGSLTLAVINRVVRETTGSSLAGWFAAAVLGVAPTFWAQSTTANVRSLTTLFTAAQIGACLAYAKTKHPRYLDALALTLGFGVTHHSSNVPLLLPYLIFLLACDPSLLRNWRSWRRPLIIFCLPFLVLLYLPIRSVLGAPFDPEPIRTVSDFVEHVLALGFRGDMFYFVQPSALVSRGSVILNILRMQFGAHLLWLMLVGAVAAWWGQRRALLLCGGVFAVNMVLAATYRAPQTVEYMMPAYVALACAAGCGACALFQALLKEGWAHLALTAALVFPLCSLQLSYPSFHRLSRDHSAREYAEALLRQAPLGTEVLSCWHYATALWYLQYVEDMRPDVKVTYVYPEGNAPNAEVWLRRLTANEGRRPTILTNYYAEFASTPYVLQPLARALLVETQTGAPAVPDTLAPLSVSFDGLIEFLGYELEQDSTSPAGRVGLRIFWRPVVQLDRDYSFFVHLLDEAGSVVGQGDINHPANQYAPGQVLVNRYDIPLLPTARSGKHRLVAGVYITLAEGGWRRLLADDGGDAIQIAEVDVHPTDLAPVTSSPMQHPSDSGWVLCGIDYDHSLPGQSRVYAHWRSRGTATSEHRVVLVLSEGRVETMLPLLPEGAYQTTALDLGGEHVLWIEVRDGTTGAAYTWRGPWQSHLGDRLRLPAPISGERYVPLGGDMVLLGARYPSQCRAGAELAVSLKLVGARPIVNDYAVSLSLWGETGEWQAQHDGVPAMGAIPTLKWIRGTVVEDRHVFVVPAHAVGQGVLRLVVYDAFDLRPLPVLDERLARLGQGTHMELAALEVLP